jgi:hypothetical protein
MVNLPQDPELRELYLAADLLLAVEAFKQTTVGQYLLLRAAMDRTDALAELVDVEMVMTIRSEWRSSSTSGIKTCCALTTTWIARPNSRGSILSHENMLTHAASSIASS